MSDSTRTHDDAVSLLDLIAVIARRKWLIVGITGGVALATVALMLVMMTVPSTSKWNVLPVLYKPTAKVLVEDPTKGSSLSSVLGQSGLGALSGLVGGSGGKATSADLAKALLASNSVSDTIAGEFGILERVRLAGAKAPRTSAREVVTEATEAKFDEKSGILVVGYKDTDAARATQVVNRMVDLLDAEFKRLTVGKAGEKREYLEKSIAALETEAKKASDSLIAFQTRYGTVDFTAQAAENTKAVVQLQTQITTRQMELDLQKKYLPESDSRIVKLKAELAGLQQLMTDLREGGGEYNTSQVSQKTIPALSVEFLNLRRNLEIAQATLGVLKQQYEMARLESLGTTATFQVIEKAEVPEMRASPQRARITVIATVAGFFISILVAFIVEYFHRAGEDPAEAGKLAAIRSSLSFRRRKPQTGR
jgi:tyrosine-protein kinase Etk/Wzc